MHGICCECQLVHPVRHGTEKELGLPDEEVFLWVMNPHDAYGSYCEGSGTNPQALLANEPNESDCGNPNERNVTKLNNGQTLGALHSAIDNDPIVQGVEFNGEPLRQSQIKTLVGDEPDPDELVWVDENNELTEVTSETDTTWLYQVKRVDYEMFRDWP